MKKPKLYTLRQAEIILKQRRQEKRQKQVQAMKNYIMHKLKALKALMPQKLTGLLFITAAVCIPYIDNDITGSVYLLILGLWCLFCKENIFKK